VQNYDQKYAAIGSTKHSTDILLILVIFSCQNQTSDFLHRIEYFWIFHFLDEKYVPGLAAVSTKKLIVLCVHALNANHLHIIFEKCFTVMVQLYERNRFCDFDIVSC